MSEQLTVQQRAEAAAEALAAEGSPVTARTVRQRARVNMSVAAAVARAWNEREAESREVPAMPDAVLARMEGLWREAVAAARDEHQAERDGWAAQLAAVEAERDALGEDVDRAEAERDEAVAAAEELGEELRSRISDLERQLEAERASLATAAAATAAAEGRAAAAEGVAEGLREGVAELRAALAALTPKGK
ncbi:MAG: DNA-binding protein [Actinobacteria bacterium]|nr:DNA-binding protein [Actinomycetota bacterium]